MCWLPHQPEALANLKRHGIRVERVLEGFRAEAESFMITAVEPDKNIYQGRVQNVIKGQYEKAAVDIPAGSYYIGLDQPLARLVPVLLEPESVGQPGRLGVLQPRHRPAVEQPARALSRPAPGAAAAASPC